MDELLSRVPWVAPIVVFGLVVFVHELGHFLAAKWTGVYAPRFSIGFGPALLRKRWGETEYILAALPLGGYVRMASREDEASAFLEGGSETSTLDTTGANAAGKIAGDGTPDVRPKDWDPEALVPFGPKPVPEHRWFESKSLPQRLLIMVAGVTMNIILALVVTIGLVAHYGRSITDTRVLGGVRDVPGAETLRQSLQVGDTIVAVNGKPVRIWEDVQRAVLSAEGDVLSIATHRDTVEVFFGATGQPTKEQLVTALDPYQRAVIDSVVPGRAASRAGLQKGDTVVAIDGTPIRSWTEMVLRVERAAGVPLTFDVIRGGDSVRMTARPDSQPVTSRRSGSSQRVGVIGVTREDISRREPIAFGEAVTTGWRATWAMAFLVVEILRNMFSGNVPLSELGGPIAIAEASVTAARFGLVRLFELLALLSINVAVLNLLPIPILDGGQILLNVAETARGRAFSVRTREYILRAGLLAIGLLFVLVMFNDIKRLVERLIN